MSVSQLLEVPWMRRAVRKFLEVVSIAVIIYGGRVDIL